MEGIRAVYVPVFSAPVTCRVLERVKSYPLDEFKILITARWTKKFYENNGYHPAYAYGQIYTVLYHDLFDKCRFIKSGGSKYASGKNWHKFFDEKKIREYKKPL